MYSGDIVWQLPDYLRLIKFIALKFLTLANNFIMSSSSDITSDLASAFVSLDSYLDTVTKTIDSTDLINQEVRNTQNASPLSTASTDYFAILEEVENQTLIESACLDIQYSKDIDERLAQHDATAIGLLINIIRAAELVERTARILPNPRHTSILLHLQRRIRNLAVRLMPDDAKTIIREVVHEVCGVLLRTRSCVPTPLIHLFLYLCQLKVLLPLHLRILLLAYALCLFRRWLHCKCCRKQLLHLMNQRTPSEEHTVDALQGQPEGQELHVPPLLPLPTLPTVIANALHPRHPPPHPASPS